jgi:signal transduction histidine kinase
MPATASDRRRSGYRLAAREVPVAWLSAAALAVLGLLLIAGGGPLRPALATFGLGALAVTWLHAVAARRRGRRRAERVHAAVMREGLARLRDAHGPDAGGLAGAAGRDGHDLLAALAALSGADAPGAPRSLAAAVRAAAATARPDAEARDVRLLIAVDQDTRVRVAGLEPALRGLLRHAAAASPPGATVTVAVRPGRVELRAAAPPADGFAADLARAIAHRAGGDLHVFADGPGMLAVLELPVRDPDGRDSV